MKAKTDEPKPAGEKPGGSADSKPETPSVKPGSKPAAKPDPKDDLKTLPNRGSGEKVGVVAGWTYSRRGGQVRFLAEESQFCMQPRYNARPISSRMTTQTRILSFLAAAAFSTPLALAGDPTIDYKAAQPVACPPDTLDWVTVKGEYTFTNDFERGHDSKGDATHTDFEYDHRIPVNLFNSWPNVECGHWYFRLGAEYDRWDFGNSGKLPIPNTLQSASGIVALEYVVNDGAAIMLETRPGVYFEHNARRDSIDAPTKLYFPIYHHKDANSSVTVITGVAYTNLLSYQFLPIVGIDYETGKWEVRAVVPAPRIIYQATDRVGVYVGGEVTGGGFRSDAHEDYPGKPQLSNAIVTYSEFRAGAGVTYKISRCTLDLGAGYAFDRKFDYSNADQGFKASNGSPYISGTLRIGF